MGEHTKISVLMSVYNTDERYLHESLDSVLNQSYKEFEFLVINDCSNKETTKVLHDYAVKDKRVQLIENEHNLGLTKSLNIGLRRAQGDYIARIDSDDKCEPERLKKQLDFMEQHPEVTVLGCRVNDGRKKCRMSVHIPWEWRKVQLITSNCGLVHSSAFIRREFLETHNICYDETKMRAQDYKLWADITLSGGRIEILDENLVMFRKHEGSISVRYKEEQNDAAVMISAEQLANLLPDKSAEEIHDLMINVKCGSRDKKQLKELLQQATFNNPETAVVYNNKLLQYELMYLYNKYAGKQEWQSIGYWWYRIRRALYKMI
jgi:glycosyltransferase involved in cell wall biosynthesis